LNAGELLKYIGQPTEASNLASDYLKIYLFAAPAYLGYESLRRFLVVQNVVNLFIWIGASTALVIHPLCLWILVPQLGFIGAPLAHAVSSWLQLAIAGSWVVYLSPHQPETWGGIQWKEALSWDCVQVYLKLGIPGIMAMSEWWFWEIVCFTAGAMGTEPLAAHTVAYNLIPIMFMIPLGMSIGANVRIGTLLGEGNHARAKQVALGTLAAYCVLGSVYITGIYFTGQAWARLFTDDAAILTAVQEIWWLVCVDIWIDSLFGVQSGIMRGIAMQTETSVGVLIFLWIMGLPLIRWVCFGLDGGLYALWAILPVIYGLLNIYLAVAWLCYADFATMSEDIHATAKQETVDKLGTIETSVAGDAGDPMSYAPVLEGDEGEGKNLGGIEGTLV